ncbi:MAG: hypothetical protein HY549_03260 [Elusimicrobia bacterium]|nr:hypothetical protein [Elusimicrobiota bacterium]
MWSSLYERARREGGSLSAWLAAALLSLPALFFPISNPDLFWHLSAGRWMIESGVLPRQDFLSFTRYGQPWLNFEWLSQWVFEQIFRHGGFTGLWLFKAATLAAAGLLLDRTLGIRGASLGWRAAGLALWSTAILPYSDIRPENFSILLLAACLCLIERRRVRGFPWSPAHFMGWAALFALWSNLHPGFLLAFPLLACYGLCHRESRFAADMAIAGLAGLAATLINPYGVAPWLAIMEHLGQGAQIGRYINEWRGLSLGHPLFWPFIAFESALALLLCLSIFRSRNMAGSSALALAWIGLAAASLRHRRLVPYWGLLSVPLFLALVGVIPRIWLKRAALTAAACYALYFVWLFPRVSWTARINAGQLPVGAAGFMERERGLFEGKRVYNQWEWGGYLGWRLHPWHKVFFDGRALFHPDLVETAKAGESSGLWIDYMRRGGFAAALLPNRDIRFPSTRLYRDGSKRDFQRPWYLYYMPRESWALVYWDAQALLFVDRKAFLPRWLARHEYRYWRPKDEAAFADALARGEMPQRVLAKERRRQQSDSAMSLIDP